MDVPGRRIDTLSAIGNPIALYLPCFCVRGCACAGAAPWLIALPGVGEAARARVELVFKGLPTGIVLNVPTVWFVEVDPRPSCRFTSFVTIAFVGADSDMLAFRRSSNELPLGSGVDALAVPFAFVVTEVDAPGGGVPAAFEV